MKNIAKPLLLTALMGAASGLSFAQAPSPSPKPAASANHDGMGKMDPAQMQERMKGHMAQQAAELKSKLKLSAAQESAWSLYSSAMQIPPNMKRPQRSEMDKLSTPERLDKMQELRKERDAEMDKRYDATKAFYAQLTPEQKTIFDANTRHGMGMPGRNANHEFSNRS